MLFIVLSYQVYMLTNCEDRETIVTGGNSSNSLTSLHLTNFLEAADQDEKP